MKIHTNTIITDYENKPVMFEEDGKKIPLTFRKAVMVAINALENSMPIEEKVKVYHLSLKLSSANEVEVNIDEMSVIKDKVGKTFNPVIVGRVIDHLEGKEIPAPIEPKKEEIIDHRV